MQVGDRRTEIIETACMLFNKIGYNNVTMRVLASEIGVKGASLYNHISSKQEILSTIIITVAEQFVKRMDEVVADDSNTIEKIKNIIVLHIELTLNNPNGMASLQNDWMYLEGGNLIYFKKMRKEYESSFRSVIEKGVAEGALKNVNPEIILFSILTTLQSLYVWYPRQKKIEKNKLKQYMIAVLLKGICE